MEQSPFGHAFALPLSQQTPSRKRTFDSSSGPPLEPFAEGQDESLTTIELSDNPEEARKIMKAFYYQLDRFRKKLGELGARGTNLRTDPKASMFTKPLKNMKQAQRARLVSLWLRDDSPATYTMSKIADQWALRKG